jgi:hypothetical protein
MILSLTEKKKKANILISMAFLKKTWPVFIHSYKTSRND